MQLQGTICLRHRVDSSGQLVGELFMITNILDFGLRAKRDGVDDGVDRASAESVDKVLPPTQNTDKPISVFGHTLFIGTVIRRRTAITPAQPPPSQNDPHTRIRRPVINTVAPQR